MPQYVLFGRPLTSYIIPTLTLLSIYALFSTRTLTLLASHPQTTTLAHGLAAVKGYYLYTKVYLYKVGATVAVLAGIVWALSPGERRSGTKHMGTLNGPSKDIQAGPVWKGNPYRFTKSAACDACG
ncbi:hypothetical protein HMN09_00129100 [Mycena chlorophos]|uniref:Uncharacterized protein n=1 Tax=Mycena chlorophos TaxID=658473 RepID=A0A8H6TQN3_MYCCL|nr:hypothetical protein HMN09_00129100 [Mycena chlorophos]